MPVEGYKTITVSEETYSKLNELAKKNYTTIPRVIELLIDKYKENKQREKEAGSQVDC